MTTDQDIIQKVMKCVLKCAKRHLKTTEGISISSAVPSSGELDTLTLRDVTAIMGVGGPVNLLVAFSFDRSLAAFLFHAETVGLPMTDDEHYPFLLEIAAETINTVLGHSTVDLAEESNNVILSAPVVIEEARRLHRPKGASFAAISLTTSRGILDMNFIVPKHLFDNKLNIVAC